MRFITCMAVAAGLALATAGVAEAQSHPTPIPREAMVAERVLTQMQLSPDGEHLAAITSFDGGDPAISIWRTDSLSTTPRRFGITGAAQRRGVRFSSINWVADDRLLVIMQQPLTAGAGAENKTYTALARFVDLQGREWIEPLAAGGTRSDLERYVDRFLTVSLVSELPREPRHVLMEQGDLDGRAVYRVDVYTGRGERVLQIGDDESVLDITDVEGRLRVKQFAELRGADYTIGHQIFNLANGVWEEHPLLTFSARSRRNMEVLGFDPQNQDLLIIADNEGQNLTYIRGYSISQRAFVETLFSHPRWEATGIITDNLEGVPGRTEIVGFRFYGATEEPYYIDERLAALHASLRQQLGNQSVTIGARWGRHRLIVAESSRHPPSYYLLTDETTLAPLGSSQPGIDPSQLADTQLVYYPARDGLQIPGFLTLPRGWTPEQGRLPVIIQPHGGPWSRNDASWGGSDIPVTQYFASRGFAVLQPQFRGSTGFGDQLWKAGDEQWGLKMQDDKDDGLAWLVSQGIGDPDRALIYGFSYGGFAAMAAVVRDNPPYRCAISGAGVSSLERLGTLWRENRIQRQLQGWTLKGMDPLQNAARASIPILIYHGDRDQTATLWHSERFAAALRAAGKPHEFVVIPDMPHGAVTPGMREQEFRIVEDYIRGPCGISF